MQNPNQPENLNNNGKADKPIPDMPNLKDGRLDKEDVDSVKGQADSYGKYMGAGFQMLAPILIGVALGWWLDKEYHPEKPLWIVICPVVMIVVALYQFVKQFLKP